MDKLFEAALHQKAPPSRFGTPESQRKSGPAAHGTLDNQAANVGSRFQRGTPQEQAPFQSDVEPPDHAPQQAALPSQGFDFAPLPAHQSSAVDQRYAFGSAEVVEEQATASLDNTINSELAAILDEKVAKEKRSKRRSLMITALIFFGVTGGGSAWFVSNPGRVAALNQTIAEIKSVGDIKGMVTKYQQSLDKVAVRGEQINAATVLMGVEPASVADIENQGFDQEMRTMMGESAGPTTAARDALVRKKFSSVQQSGTLMPGK
ncbi:hypothetical protein [Luteolibacter sp. AS25]|uniref:hypothetical protein n=1 Tax=Luteolibacter sp. AS25 TaxID=3135776 RepID=UPI00398AC9F4